MDLEALRDKIDETDFEILKLLVKRFEIVREIDKVKKLVGEQAHQPKRYEQMVQLIVEQAKQVGLSEQFVKQIWDIIHKESIRLQKAKK
jgi:chorismate mutase